jgi:hypothetical protein
MKEKVFALFLLIIYSGWVIYLVNKNHSFFFDLSLLIMFVYVWYKGIKLFLA